MPLGDNFNWSGAAQYLDLDPSWYEDDSQLQADIQAKWDKATPAQRQNFSRKLASQPKPQARSTPQVNPMYNDYGMNMAMGGFNAAMMGAGGQNRALQGMAGDVMQAFANENESRVAQAREMRRMEYQREIERMRQETEQQKINALIQRLKQQNSAGYMNPAEGLYLR